MDTAVSVDSPNSSNELMFCSTTNLNSPSAKDLESPEMKIETPKVITP